MITTLSALREMMLSPVDGRSPSPPRAREVPRQEAVDRVTLSRQAGDQAAVDGAAEAASVEFSVSRDVFAAVDDFYNLGKSGRFDAFHALSPGDKEEFVKIVAELSKAGYVGYEELVVDDRVERHEVTSRIGDRRLYHAQVYDNSRDGR